MVAAGIVPLLEEEMDRRKPSKPDVLSELHPEGATSVEEQFENWTAKELSIRAINATLALAQEVGHLARVVMEMEKRLTNEYEDTKTHELKTLKARDQWFKRIITAVVTAVAIAEVMRWLGLGGHGG